MLGSSRETRKGHKSNGCSPPKKPVKNSTRPIQSKSHNLCGGVLDGFKPVNDTFGHAAGDEVLKMVAERLRGAARGHMVARLGGDEFAILMIGEVGDIADVAKGCIAAFKSSFRVEGATVDIGISIGVSAAPENGEDGEVLVQEADRALYRAKANGRNTWRTASDGRRQQTVSGRLR
ncbi:GGDEF domain-containing protein [Rhizobium sp. CCGE532]|uniref:GGDEF domain-containing protein n=1 Tax=Rhizobium sp. CCGE532 TaxID=2364272 RepID=UPI001FE17559|nr:GGDEF domain-containing protein [Rhizobium sp. CCGE532]